MFEGLLCMDIATLECHFAGRYTVPTPGFKMYYIAECCVQIICIFNGGSGTSDISHSLVTCCTLYMYIRTCILVAIVQSFLICCHKHALYFAPQKRRQAQLTRLHRQVQEAQARRRQWGNQVDTLRSTITLLQQKLAANSTLD